MEDNPKIIAPFIDGAERDFLAHRLGIHPSLAGLLINRGVRTITDAVSFLNPSLENLHLPQLMKGMQVAVTRVLKALDGGEKILVYGDFDADGVTGVAVLSSFLQYHGADVTTYIPSRMTEGYGLHLKPLANAVDSGVSLIITVDCGIAAKEEVDFINKRGADCIITDHHEVPEELPSALAVLNPKQKDCKYPYKELAGNAVAFKLCQGILKHINGIEIDEMLKGLLDLVALGTVADIVPLTGENRILVKVGLDEMKKPRPGLQALINKAGLDNRRIDAGHLGFQLAPRINAAGRLENAGDALDLLLVHCLKRGMHLAEQLEKLNTRRQQLENQITEEARFMLTDSENELVLVGSSQDWHPGVLGIAASRLVEEFYRPVFLISTMDQTGKGSARSIPGFNIYEALQKAGGYLDKHGGHRMAAGFTVKTDLIDRLAKKLEEVARPVLTADILRPAFRVDGQLEPGLLDEELVMEMEKFAPFGLGNPRPLFFSPDLNIGRKRQVGESGNHLSLMVGDKGVEKKAIAFKMGDKFSDLQEDQEYNFIYSPRINEWNGRQEVNLEIRHIGSKDMEISSIHKTPCLHGALYIAGNLSLGRQDFLQKILEEIEDGGVAVLLVPTCCRAAEVCRFLKVNKFPIGFSVFTGLQDLQKISQRLETIKNQKESHLIVTTLNYLLHNPAGFLPLKLLAWESPFFEIPPAAFYSALESLVFSYRIQQNTQLIGLEFPGSPGRWFEWKGEKKVVNERQLKVEIPQGNRDNIISSLSGKATICVDRRNYVFLKRKFPHWDVINNRNPIGETDARDMLVLYHHPLTANDFRRNLDLIGDGKVYILGRDQDLAQNRNSWLPLEMERKYLVSLYRHIKEAAKSEHGNLSRIKKSWQGNRVLFEYGLKVFQELGLVKIFKNPSGNSVEFNETESGTVDLYRSIGYNELIGEKASYLYWEGLISAPAEKLAGKLHVLFCDNWD